jgi:hypothetical protein
VSQYIKNCWVRLLSNYNIKYICTIYTRLDTCLMSISRFSLRGKVTLRLLKLYFYITDVVEWSRALDIRLSDWCCNGVSSNPVEGITQIWQLKDLILTLFGLIFRRIYNVLTCWSNLWENKIATNEEITQIYCSASWLPDVAHIYIYIYTNLQSCLCFLNLWSDKVLFFPRRNLNSHYWYTTAPIA